MSSFGVKVREENQDGLVDEHTSEASKTVITDILEKYKFSKA